MYKYIIIVRWTIKFMNESTAKTEKKDDDIEREIYNNKWYIQLSSTVE